MQTWVTKLLKPLYNCVSAEPKPSSKNQHQQSPLRNLAGNIPDPECSLVNEAMSALSELSI